MNYVNNQKVPYELRGVKLHGIHRYDGYNVSLDLQLPGEHTEHNSYMADKNCIVTGRSLEELKIEFGITKGKIFQKIR